MIIFSRSPRNQDPNHGRKAGKKFSVFPKKDQPVPVTASEVHSLVSQPQSLLRVIFFEGGLLRVPHNLFFFSLLMQLTKCNNFRNPCCFFFPVFCYRWLYSVLENSVLSYPSLAPPTHPSPPLLHCFTSGGSSLGEEWNPWQGSPRGLLSPCSSAHSPPSAARPASHRSSRSSLCQPG